MILTVNYALRAAGDGILHPRLIARSTCRMELTGLMPTQTCQHHLDS